MSKARAKVEEFLTQHYKYLETAPFESKEEQAELLSYFNAKHWAGVSIKELAEELHQILWDSDNDSDILLQIVELLASVKNLEGGKEVWQKFKTTREHSH